MPLSLADMPKAGSAFNQVRLLRNNRLGGLNWFNAELGDVGRFSMVFGDMVLANSPALVHDVLVTHARSYEKSPVLRGALHPIAGEGLFTSEGELWRRQRKLMAPLFQPGFIGQYAPDMTAAAERAARTFRDGETLDMTRETNRITMAIAGKTLFEADTFDEADELGAALTVALEWAGAQSGSPTLIAQGRAFVALSRLADHVPPSLSGATRRLAARAILPIYWPGERTRALKRALGVLDAKVARLIADRRAHPEKRGDLLAHLLAARDEEAGRMSEKQVRDEVLTLFIAGHETTANGLAWSLMLLAQHPEIYARVREEVSALGRVPELSDAPKLGLCLRVFKEAMRLYPPIFLFGRVAIEDAPLGDYTVPKGTVVLVSPYALHRRPSLYPDPERFDPDRFTPEEEARRPKSAYIPFSAGPRTCIGNHFALLEGPLVLATLLRHADFELEGLGTAVPDAAATLRPKGLYMRVRLRRPPASRP
jgi:cytochrome P450